MDAKSRGPEGAGRAEVLAQHVPAPSVCGSRVSNETVTRIALGDKQAGPPCIYKRRRNMYGLRLR